jgi:hypothetical protein
MPGPVPKRSDQRRRTNTDGGQVTKAAAAVRVDVPDADEEWHPIAARWYRSLAGSGQSAFYEPSDWAMAFFIAEGMSRCLLAQKMSGQMFTSVAEASTRLLVTEGDRRRLRLELERHSAAGDVDEDAAVTQMDAWRERLGS